MKSEVEYSTLNPPTEGRAMSPTPSLSPGAPEWIRSPDAANAYCAQISALGFVVSPLTHEINGRFSAIMGFITQMEDLAEIVFDSAQKESLAGARRSMDEALAILRSANRQGRSTLGDLMRVRPTDLLAEVDAQIRAGLDATIRLTCVNHVPETALLTHPYQMATGLRFLAQRACRAMRDGGALTLVAETATLGPDRPCTHLNARFGTYTAFTLTDTGTTIPEDRLRDMFVTIRSQSAEEATESWGMLGTYTMLRRLSCGLSIEPCAPQGTKVTVFIPRVQTA
jgi:hypothetical protein